MANFRPLQPAPMDPQQHSMQPIPPLAQRPKRTVTLGACVACRKRKSKCDGIRPVCSCCSQKDTQCVYELAPNEKPSQAIKRKNAEMQDELSNLRQLYELLRLRPESEALAILRQIRSESLSPSSSQDYNKLAISARQDQLSSDSLSSHHFESTHSLTLPPLRLVLGTGEKNVPSMTRSIFSAGFDEPSSQRRKHAPDTDVANHSDTSASTPPPTSIEALLQPETVDFCDDRLKALTNWTSVSKDTQFLTNLMSLWHKWEYNYYHYLDWDIFLEEMSSGGTYFCSELLVNSLLASASFHSSLVKNRSTPFGDSITTRFYREARRLWEAGEGEGDSLTRIQAALALWGVFARHGRDKVGLLFLQEACQIAQRLGLFRIHSLSHRSQHAPQDKWEKVRAVTAWALFNIQSTITLSCSLPPLITTPPPVAIPYEDAGGTEDLFRDECGRSTVLAEHLNLLMSSHDSTSNTPTEPEPIEVFYNRIKLWFDHRRQSLCPLKHPSPENILTAMLYHSMVLRLFRPLVKHENSDEPLRSYGEHVRTRVNTAMAELRQLILLYEDHVGWKSTIAMILHPIFVFAFTSLEELSEQEHASFLSESNPHYQGLLMCLKALSTISTYTFYAQLLFRLLASSCQSLNVPLPMEIMGVVARFQSDEWTKNAANMVSSMYIVDLRRAATDHETTRMDSIISGWNALTIKDEYKPPQD